MDQSADSVRLRTNQARRPQPSPAPTGGASPRRAQPEPHLTARDVMTATEVAALLGVPVSTVHHWAREGTIPSRKLGKRRIFVRPKLESLLLSDAD